MDSIDSSTRRFALPSCIALSTCAAPSTASNPSELVAERSLSVSKGGGGGGGGTYILPNSSVGNLPPLLIFIVFCRAILSRWQGICVRMSRCPFHGHYLHQQLFWQSHLVHQIQEEGSIRNFLFSLRPQVCMYKIKSWHGMYDSH